MQLDFWWNWILFILQACVGDWSLYPFHRDVVAIFQYCTDKETTGQWRFWYVIFYPKNEFFLQRFVSIGADSYEFVKKISVHFKSHRFISSIQQKSIRVLAHQYIRSGSIDAYSFIFIPFQKFTFPIRYPNTLNMSNRCALIRSYSMSF